MHYILTSSLSGSWSSVLGLENEEKGIFCVLSSAPSSCNVKHALTTANLKSEGFVA